MPIITAEKGEDFTVLPEGTVITVKVEKTETRTVGEGSNSWESLDFQFTIVGVSDERWSEAVGQTIWGGANARLTEHQDNKLRKWVKALLGIDVVEGFKLDTDVLVGRQARAVVENYTKGSGQNQMVRHKVGALLEAPAPGWQPGQAPQAFPQPGVPQPQFPQQFQQAPAPQPAPQPQAPQQAQFPQQFPAPPQGYVPPSSPDDVPF